MDMLGAAENAIFYRARLEMNPRVTLEIGF